MRAARENEQRSAKVSRTRDCARHIRARARDRTGAVRVRLRQADARADDAEGARKAAEERAGAIEEAATEVEAQMTALRAKLDRRTAREKEASAARKAAEKDKATAQKELDSVLAAAERLQAECDAARASAAGVEKLEKELDASRSARDAAVRERDAAAVRARDAETAMGALRLTVERERVARRKATERVFELQGNIRVLCRVRPLARAEKLAVERNADALALEPEAIADPESALQVDDDDETILAHGTPFVFDRSFGVRTAQESVFREARARAASGSALSRHARERASPQRSRARR